MPEDQGDDEVILILLFVMIISLIDLMKRNLTFL
jgi:hypothetical protein